MVICSLRLFLESWCQHCDCVFLLFGKTDRIISTLNIIHQTFSFFNNMPLVDGLLKPDATYCRCVVSGVILFKWAPCVHLLFLLFFLFTEPTLSALDRGVVNVLNTIV